MQTVLEQRQAREDQLQTDLVACLQEEAVETARLAELLRKLDDAVAAVQSALSENSASVDLASADEYAKCLRDDVKVQQMTLRAVRSKVEAKRAELVDAMKERKVLESLRDRQEREHLAVQMRAEQNEFDDMASVRYGRNLRRRPDTQAAGRE